MEIIETNGAGTKMSYVKIRDDKNKIYKIFIINSKEYFRINLVIYIGKDSTPLNDYKRYTLKTLPPKFKDVITEMMI